MQNSSNKPNKPKKQPTLTKKVVLGWMVALLFSNFVIGSLGYMLYKNQLYDTRAVDAQNIAIAISERIDGDMFDEIMNTLEKNDYWYEIKDYVDRLSVVFDAAYIYVMDDKYTDKATYFAEAATYEDPSDLGTTETIKGVFADEMFETLSTGVTTSTTPYASGDYGKMLSGFSAIYNNSGKIVGVVGVDFYCDDIQARVNMFGLSLIGIIAVISIFLYFAMTYLGTRLAGIPLTQLDGAAKKLSSGDMDISFKINSSTEIGRLAESFTRMVDGMRAQTATLEALSHGDLTSNVRPRSDKDVMGIAIAKMIDNLNDMFNEINRSATQVSIGARQISDSAQSLSHGASEQSSAIERLSASISDVTAKANENLAIADKANALADSITTDAQISSDHMGRMTIAVKDISDASVSINKVIKVIDDIAFQTNILALNAAVEAARAGQHGKGFAVVADEVRNLAAKSAEAAKDTEQLISDSIEKAQLGATIAAETAASLGRITEKIRECAVLVDSIAMSFAMQLRSMSDINSAVEQVSHVVQQNSATAEESAAASVEMSTQSDNLEGMILRFKLKKRD